MFPPMFNLFLIVEVKGSNKEDEEEEGESIVFMTRFEGLISTMLHYGFGIWTWKAYNLFWPQIYTIETLQY